MKNKGHILIIDDDPDVLFTARTILKRQYEKVTVENSPNRLEHLLATESIDLVILDMNFKAGITSGNEGLYWLKKIKEIAPEVQVLMNTAYGDINLAVESMKLGAVDFLVKPWEKEKLIATVNTVFELHLSKKEVKRLSANQAVLLRETEAPFEQMIFASKAMDQIDSMIERIARTDASVLITGENGTGKEVVARRIHRLSARSSNPLVKVDLGSLSESLFESELFGHQKGAFTDAKEDRIGRFEMAEGSTLLLDEIGNLSEAMQAKLLSVLQNKVIYRVGSSKPLPIDVRIVAATNTDINSAVEKGAFRQDLLYRINTLEIEIPPLRERMDDLSLLANHFVKQYGEKYQKPGLKITPSTLKSLQTYPWPGNVRELQHAVERAVIMSTGSVLEAEDFLLKKMKVSNAVSPAIKVEDAEKAAIERALKLTEFNQSKAAKALGIGRTTLYRKMKKYGLD